MIGKIREIVTSILEEERTKKDKIVILDPGMLGEPEDPFGIEAHRTFLRCR